MLTKQWRQVLANEINKAKKTFHMNAVELLSHITQINKKTTKVMNVHDSLPKEKEKKSLMSSPYCWRVCSHGLSSHFF